jgi:single-stranded-DNA-specific exonuclease
VIDLALTKQQIEDKFALHPIVAEILKNREIDTTTQLNRYLYGSFDYLHDPTTIPNIEEIAKTIKTSLLFGDNVLIYGDFDVDGTSSTALLYRVLSRVGSNINLDWMVSNRYVDGYGLSKESIDKMVDKDTDLLITVDCGISENENIEYAKSKGIEVIVVDHHENEGELPDCDFLDLKVNSGDYPFTKLCGCGIAWKLAQVVLDDDLYDLLDIVAMATVADVVELEDENRIIVKEGLKKIRARNNINPGIQELISRNEIQNEDIKAHHFGFKICPMINAPGRVDPREGAKPSVELMIADHDMKIKTTAFTLRQKNEERKTLSKQALKDARSQVSDDDNIVVYRGEMLRGIVGLVAGDLQEEFEKPAIVFGGEDDEGLMKGSCRSVKPLNMYKLLMGCDEYLNNFGGHKMAAGLSLNKDNFNSFHKRVKTLITGIEYETIEPEIEKSADEMSKELVREIDTMSPFGRANPKPKFIDRNIDLEDVKTTATGEHLRCKAKGIGCIGFYMGELESLCKNNTVDLIYQPDINDYYGKRLQLKIKKLNVVDNNKNNYAQDTLF